MYSCLDNLKKDTEEKDWELFPRLQLYKEVPGTLGGGSKSGELISGQRL